MITKGSDSSVPVTSHERRDPKQQRENIQSQRDSETVRRRWPRTHLLQGPAVVLLREEVDVTGGDDAHQLAAHLARLGDGDSREAMPCLGLEHVPDRVARAHHHGVRDEALLEFLPFGRRPVILLWLVT